MFAPQDVTIASIINGNATPSVAKAAFAGCEGFPDYAAYEDTNWMKE